MLTYSNNPINFGFIPSKDDNRDYNYSRIATVTAASKLPDKFMLDLKPIRDQGKSGTCVGFATAKIQECDGMTKNEQDVLSPLYLYNRCKAIDGLKVEGTTLRDAMKVLSSNGICKENLYSYVDNADTRALKFPNIPQSATSDAGKRKIIGYARLNTLQEVLNAIFNENGAMLGVLVTDSFMTPENGVVGVLNGNIYGGHAIPAIGWDSKKVVKLTNSYGEVKSYTGVVYFANSWGAEWGENGLGMIPFDLFDIAAKEEAWALKLVNEAWTTIHATNEDGTGDPDYHKRKNGLLDPIKPEPTPTPTPSGGDKIVLQMTIKDKNLYVNGKAISMLVAPQIISGRTLTPIREPFEAIGGKVDWNANSKKITVTFNKDDVLKKF